MHIEKTTTIKKCADRSFRVSKKLLEIGKIRQMRSRAGFSKQIKPLDRKANFFVCL